MDDHYTYSVFWSAADGEFVGSCAEFRSLSHLDETPEAAMAGIRALVQDVIEDIRQGGETVPVPLADRGYSGQFMTRVPPALHQSLVAEAAMAGVSLNRLVAFKLGVGSVPSDPHAGRGTKADKPRRPSRGTAPTSRGPRSASG